MVRLEPFKSAQGAGTFGRLWWIGGGMVWKVWFGAGFNRANCFDADIVQGEIEVEEGRIGSITSLGSAHELG